MAGSSDSSISSSLPSLPPSPGESASTSSSGVAPPPPPPPPPPPLPAKQRKKPGPKPKPKVPQSLIIKLRLGSDHLKNFPQTANALTKSPQDLTPGTAPVSPPQQVDAMSPMNSDLNATPVPPSLDRPKGTPGPKPGSKRGRQPGAQPSKPGRKRTKLDPNASPATHHSNHGKLGPKANQGAINAGLRALDRTGRPCKRWEKSTFRLKSFTGVQWSVPTWGAPLVDSSAPPTPPPGTTPEVASAAPSVTSETPEIRIHPDMMNIDPPNHFEQPYVSERLAV